MRSLAGSEKPSLLPDPGTTEVIELGCTCRVIAHQSATDEAEPAGMLTVPDANCPLHAEFPLGPTRPTEGSSLQCDGGPGDGAASGCGFQMETVRDRKNSSDRLVRSA